MSNRGNIFKTVPVSVPDRSWEDMSFSNTLSCNIGSLIPTLQQECLPKDVLHHREYKFIRCAPMLSPVFGKLNLFSYKFFVRFRDIATYFDTFITNGDQRLDWRANLDGTFIPPVKSKYQPLQFLMNTVWSQSFVPHHGYGIFSALTSGIYNTDFLQTSLDNPPVDNNWSSVSNIIDWDYWYKNFQCLRISYDGVSSFNVDVIDGYNSQIIDTTNYLNSLYIFYRPNYNEFEVDEVREKLGDDIYHQRVKINPFSPGTLLDYLGVDLKGLYLKQWPLFQRMLWKMEDVWSSSVITSHLSSEILKVFDLEEFFNTHFVQCVVMVGNSHVVNYSGSGLSDQNYQYFQANGFLDPVSVKKASAAAVEAIYRTYGYWPLDQDQDIMAIDMLPVHAYNFVYNEYFRDQNLIPINNYCDFDRQGLFVPNGVSDDELADYYDYFSLKSKAWEHDCFTSALPGPQRGQAVRFLTDASTYMDISTKNVPAGTSYYGSTLSIEGGPLSVSDNVQTTSQDTVRHDILVDLSQATIENFRWANSMQKFLERKARTGNRYFELIRGMWDIEVDDAKINRPIYLSGDKQPIQISEIVQTSATNTDTGQPLGDLAGRGASQNTDEFVEYMAPDYGFYMEFVCVVPRTSYMRGLSKKWTRMTYLDYPWPDFMKLGEELVDKRELMFDGSNSDQPFGFLPRYYDWRYNPDEIHGEFKNSLDFWNFGRDFDQVPALNRKFIEVDSDYRQFAVTNKQYHHFYLLCEHDLQMQRSMPSNPVPDL